MFISTFISLLCIDSMS